MENIKQIIRYSSILTDNSIKCKCGHTVVIPPHQNKKLCSWCGNYVFKTKRDEFEYRLRGMLKNEKNK